MKNKTTAIMTSVLLALSNTAIAEECYGIVLAGENDCATSLNVCAGHSLEDGQVDAYIDMPSGLCEKLVGGSLKPK
ncbi:Putative signal peptide protein [uncultured Candidatus Thioglobus sp.]|nr:Putative signal peptide protein [uncultured Candidatus Thioglobus sp.]SMN02250.1 Putative signal peptide protein [uncultured Candidatus Thioglobus sp.]